MHILFLQWPKLQLDLHCPTIWKQFQAAFVPNFISCLHESAFKQSKDPLTTRDVFCMLF